MCSQGPSRASMRRLAGLQNLLLRDLSRRPSRDRATRSAVTLGELFRIQEPGRERRSSTPGCHPRPQVSLPATGLRESWDTQGDTDGTLKKPC